jgi:hypothetical protein
MIQSFALTGNHLCDDSYTLPWIPEKRHVFVEVDNLGNVDVAYQTDKIIPRHAFAAASNDSASSQSNLRDNPDTLEPRTLKQVLDGVLKLAWTQQPAQEVSLRVPWTAPPTLHLLRVVAEFASLSVFFTQPDDDFFGLIEYVFHDGDLVAALQVVLLVYAYLVHPYKQVRSRVS